MFFTCICFRYDKSLEEDCTNLSKKWLKWDAAAEGPCPFKLEDLKDMSSSQVREFIAQLLEEEPLPIVKLQAMENAYKFNAVVNSEIRFR